MDAELKKKQLSSYLSEEDTERMSSMIGRSKKEVLGDALVRLDVVEKPEYLRGTAVLNNITGGGNWTHNRTIQHHKHHRPTPGCRSRDYFQQIQTNEDLYFIGTSGRKNQFDNHRCKVCRRSERTARSMQGGNHRFSRKDSLQGSRRYPGDGKKESSCSIRKPGIR